MRSRLPQGTTMFTGDDYNYVGLIEGDGQRHSDALLGAFAAVAPNASAAIQALDAGDPAEYHRILGPTEELARHVFAAPTFYYKTGVAFLSWLNGHQPAFAMVGGLHSARSLPHLSTLVRLADAAGALEDPDLAAERWNAYLALHGVEAGMSAHPRLSLNQATIKYADLPTALRVTAEAGITSIGLWREPVAEAGLAAATAWSPTPGCGCRRLCRGGFLTAPTTPTAGPRSRTTAGRSRRPRRCARRALPVGARAGARRRRAARGDRDLPGARSRAARRRRALVDDAAAAGVVLAIEPMHPIYAADRGVISTLGQALDVAEQFPAAEVGVVVDTFHVWWDPQLDDQIRRAGRSGRIASYQVCDWITPLPPDALLARGMMGDGHIDFPAVTGLVTGPGYAGDVEVEIFNQAIWDADPAEVATRTAKAFDAYVGL